MGYRVSIDTDECMSSGKCVADFADVFAFDDDELAVVRDDAVMPDDAELLRAARNCPSRAIRLHDESGAVIDT
ncbi:MAG: ferredoxin [Acidimicrobiales bacterium]